MIGTKPRPPASRPLGPPSTFLTHCICGQAITGSRQPECQVLTCPKCQNAVFVLADSPLAPIGHSAEKSPASSSHAKNRSPVEDFDPVRRRRRERAKRRLARRRLRKSWQRWTAPFRSLRVFFRIPALVTIGLATVLIWTGQSQFLAYRERRLAERIEQAGRDGLEKVEQGDFEHADRVFEPIRERLDLSNDSLEAYAVAAREAHVLANLLLDSIDRKITFVAQEKESRRESLLGQGILFDGEVLFKDGRAILDARVFVHDRPVQVRLGSLDQARQAGITEPGRYFFASTLQSLSADGSDWQLQLNPDHLIAIVHPSLLTPLGLADERDLVDLIEKQRRARETKGVAP
jgi:hypothetical protein